MMARLDATIAKLKQSEEGPEEGRIRVTVGNKEIRLLTQVELDVIAALHEIDAIYSDSNALHSVFMWAIGQVKKGAVPISPLRSRLTPKN